MLFYLFAAIALAGGLGVVAFRNPVTSAFSLVASFLGLAALFIHLNAFLVGVLQVLVYAGAIMVLFLFIIMLLDIKSDEGPKITKLMGLGAGLLAMVFVGMLWRVTVSLKSAPLETLYPEVRSDAHEIGRLLFGEYFFPVQVVGILLLVAPIGVVVLSRRAVR
ncbi:MAG: NADH-quinone oxidoreductase subunit J [Verrucomicrobiales bacterium]|nr:NADH-quinone oxidoreductase subunit J [Verrucomicrobiales bacterium]